MNPLLPPLNPLRVFESAARHLSFTEAASELHITPGAVSHQIKVLEAWLGFILFDRSARPPKLTPHGAVYAKGLGIAFDQIVQVTQELISAGSSQILTVRGHTTFFLRWLIPLLPAFQQAHPTVKIRLASNVDAVDFRRETADAGILYGDGSWNGLCNVPLFSDELTPVLAPALAKSLPSPLDTDQLLKLPLLHSNRRPQHWPDWIAAAGATRPASDSDIYYEDLSVIYQCAVEGLGVALGQMRYVENDLKTGVLVAPDPFVLRRARGYHLVYPESRADDPKITCFRQWLLDHACHGAAQHKDC